jgi:SulP family sulfate permease
MEAERRQRDRGTRMWFVGLNPGVLRMVQKSPLGEVLGREALHFNLEAVVAKFQAT